MSFQNEPDFLYHPFCDDFGPMNMSTTIRFIRLLKRKISECAALSMQRLVYYAEGSKRGLTNSVMLLGSYMILVLDMTPIQVAERFASISKDQLEHFRDATHCPPDFGLSLLDCWGGLHRGKQRGWIARPADLESPFWGELDVEQYEHYDDPLEADLNEIVPLKLIAFRGPKHLGGAKFLDSEQRCARSFGAEHFAEVLADVDVSDVVRLNAPEYDAGVFEAAGIRHHDLFFEDCTEPPGDVVAAFFRIVDAARGVVAVHCLAGLGRTGTLIALYMMRSHGFTAREAMGWLRVMRPGSVIGDQQRFLCTVERIRDQRSAARRALSSPAARSAPNLLHLLDQEQVSAPSPAAGPGLHPGLALARARSLDDAGVREGLGRAGGPEEAAAERALAQAAQVAAALGAQSAARIQAGRAGRAGRL